MTSRSPLDTPAPGRITAGREADRLARAVYDAFLRDLSGVQASDWRRPTDCAGWTVRDMVAHLIGAACGHASTRIFVAQYVWGLRHRTSFAGSALDAMNEYQIEGLRDEADDRLPSLLADVATKAVAGRSHRARVLGWAPVSIDAAGSWYAGMPTRTTMSELCAVVLTRDVWAHRLDLARAMDAPVALDPAVDGRIVADIVADWAHRHGQPFNLTLTGDAGGDFGAGDGGQRLTLSALDFARVMAGRRPDADVPPSHLWNTKVLF